MHKILIFMSIWFLCTAQSVPPVAPSADPTDDHEALKLTLQTVAIGAAFIIFLTREFLEFFRRRDARKRKLEAIKSYLARQCELNHWFIRGMKDSLALAAAYSDDENSKIEVKFMRNGETRLIINKGSGDSSGRMIPAVRTAELESKIIEVAELDPNLSIILDAACEGAA